MRALLRVGLGLLVLAFVLIGLAYAALRSGGVPGGERRVSAEESREVGREVRAVELSGPIDLVLRYGAQASLTVRGEERLLANIETSQDGRVLHIGTRGIVLRHRQPLEVELTLPALERVAVDGSGDTTVNGFSGERVEVELNGSGNLDFNGRYREADAAVHGSGNLNLDAGNGDKVKAELHGSGALTLAGATRAFEAESSGSGTLDAQRLRAEEVNIRQTGSGNASVSAARTLAASASGSGDIEVYGQPGQRSVSTTGSGQVEFRD